MPFAGAGFCVTRWPRLLTFTRLSLLILPRLTGLTFIRFAWLLPRFTRLPCLALLAGFTWLTRFAGLSGFALLTGLTIRCLLGSRLFSCLPCSLFRRSPLSRFLVDHF